MLIDTFNNHEHELIHMHACTHTQTQNGLKYRLIYKCPCAIQEAVSIMEGILV